MTKQKAESVTNPSRNRGNIAEVAATRVTDFVGSGKGLMLAVAVVVLWAGSGPLFGFSDTWQLVINTGTTIVTFLMVFLIQSTQNRDAKAIHLKLDELIRSKRGARNAMVDLEHCTDEELEMIQEEFKRIRQRAGAGNGRAHENRPAGGQRGPDASDDRAKPARTTEPAREADGSRLSAKKIVSRSSGGG